MMMYQYLDLLGSLHSSLKVAVFHRLWASAAAWSGSAMVLRLGWLW